MVLSARLNFSSCLSEEAPLQTGVWPLLAHTPPNNTWLTCEEYKDLVIAENDRLQLFWKSQNKTYTFLFKASRSKGAVKLSACVLFAGMHLPSMDTVPTKAALALLSQTPLLTAACPFCTAPSRAPAAARLRRLQRLLSPEISFMEGWVSPQKPTTKTDYGLLPRYSAKAICTTWKARTQMLKTDQSKCCC